MAANLGGKVTKIEFRHDGFRDLLMSNGVRRVVRNLSFAIKADAMAGSGLTDRDYFADDVDATARTSYKFPGRVLGIIECTSDASRRDQAINKTLTKAGQKQRSI